MTPDPLKPTVKALADAMGLSRQSLYTWAAEGCPVAQGPEAIRRWHQTHKRPTPRNKNMRSKLLDTGGNWDEAIVIAEQALMEAVDFVQARASTQERNEAIDAWLTDVAKLLLRRRSKPEGSE